MGANLEFEKKGCTFLKDRGRRLDLKNSTIVKQGGWGRHAPPLPPGL